MPRQEVYRVNWIRWLQMASHSVFAGSDAGGERAAAIYSLIGTAKLNGINPEKCLHAVLIMYR